MSQLVLESENEHTKTHPKVSRKIEYSLSAHSAKG